MSKRNVLNIGDKLVAGPYSMYCSLLQDLWNDLGDGANMPDLLGKFLKDSSDWELTKVPGSYTYHHYKQDRFDDDGWGCA